MKKDTKRNQGSPDHHSIEEWSRVVGGEERVMVLNHHILFRSFFGCRRVRVFGLILVTVCRHATVT